MLCAALATVVAPPRALARRLGSSSRRAVPAAPVRQARQASRWTVVPQAVAGSGTVQVIVQGLHLEVTPALRQYTEEKVQKAIHNYEGAVKEVDVKLSVRGQHGGRATDAHHQRDQIVEMTVYTLRHGIVRVEDTETDNMYAAIDLVTDKLKRKLNKVKERAVRAGSWPGRGGARGAPSLDSALGEEAPEPLDFDREAALPAEVVREKLLIISRPLSQAEALEQIEQVGHDFFIYLDSADSTLKVVYRRKSHGFGVIAPQLQLE